MDVYAIHTLERSKTRGELLESVIHLQPPLGLTLEGCGAGDSSFIRHQQEVYELVHHDQDNATAHGHAHHGRDTDQHNAKKNAPYHEGEDHDGYIHTDHGPANQHHGHAHTHHGPATGRLGHDREGGHHGHVHGHYEHEHGNDHEHDPSICTMAPALSTEDLDSIDRPTMLDSLLKRQCCKLKPPLPPELLSMPEFTPSSPPKCRRKLKRLKSATDNAKVMELSDEGHDMEDEELRPNVKATVSRNLASERRRKKLNERRFSLRALVPKISKDLQKQANNMQYILTDTNALVEDTCVEEASSDCTRRGTDSENLGHNFPIHRILELNVSKLEENLYHLKVRCKKGRGVLVQLTSALEALNFNFTHANIASVGNHILNTIVFKVLRSDELLKPWELEERIVDIVHMFGLQF